MFEWTLFPGHTTLQLLREILRMMTENRTQPEQFEDRIICMSMYNDKRFPKGHWSLLGPGNEEQWYGTHTHKPNCSWNGSAEMMMLHLRVSGHPIFRATSALDRGFLKSKGGGQLSIHYNGDSTTGKLLFRIVISVNQLSVYGAISDRCEELAQQILDHSFSSTERSVANTNEESESRISPNVVSILTDPPSTNVPVQGDLLRCHTKRCDKLPEHIRVGKASDAAGYLRNRSLGQYFMTIHDMDLTGFGHAGPCREYTSHRSDEASTPKGWIRVNTKIGSVFGSQGYISLVSIWNWKWDRS